MVVPFLNGTDPVTNEELPRILNIGNVDALSRDQCIRYLQGYGMPFSNNETIELKEEVASAIGFVAGMDTDYAFTPFIHQF